MSRFRLLLPPLLLPLLALGLLGAAKKKPEVAIRFHLETTAREDDSFAMKVTVQNPTREIYVSRIPVISEQDIVAVFPFTAPDKTAGCAFKLNEHGRLALETMSFDQKGRTVVALVDGRQVANILVDRQITDGIIAIPRGIAGAEIALLSKTFPVLGQPQKKK